MVKYDSMYTWLFIHIAVEHITDFELLKTRSNAPSLARYGLSVASILKTF